MKVNRPRGARAVQRTYCISLNNGNMRERSIAPDFPSTRSVPALPDDLHFVRRIDRRFGPLTCTLHRSIHCRLISCKKQKKKKRRKKKSYMLRRECSNPLVNFARSRSSKYLVNRMTSCRTDTTAFRNSYWNRGYPRTFMHVLRSGSNRHYLRYESS